MATVEENTLVELQALNARFAEFEQYLKDKDTAAAAAAVAAETAAAEQAAADTAAAAAAAETAAAEKVVAEQAAAAAATAESEYRTAVLNAIYELEEEPVQQTDYTNLLTEIKMAIQPNVDETAVEYYADLSVIVLVVGVLPIYLIYRFYRYVFGMLIRAF